MVNERRIGGADDVVRRCKSDARLMRVFARDRRRRLVRCVHCEDRRESDSAVSRVPPTGITAGSAAPPGVAASPQSTAMPIGHPSVMERNSLRAGAPMTAHLSAPRGWYRSNRAGKSSPVSRRDGGDGQRTPTESEQGVLIKNRRPRPRGVKKPATSPASFSPPPNKFERARRRQSGQLNAALSELRRIPPVGIAAEKDCGSTSAS